MRHPALLGQLRLWINGFRECDTGGLNAAGVLRQAHKAMCMAEKKSEIKKDMTLGEVLTKYPETAKVLVKHGFHCVGCPATFTETIEQGAKVHGMSDKEIDSLVKELNAASKK